jgi:hypothetical protein
MQDYVTSASWIWDKWLIYNKRDDIEYSFAHNEYLENSIARPEIKRKLALLLCEYHVYTPHQYNLLNEIGYPRLFSAIPSAPLPTRYETQIGNLIEILACELAKKNNYEVPILRLHINPNPDQSMKGDDILAFRFAKEGSNNTVLVGEAKFTKDFNTKTIEDAVKALSNEHRPYSISIEFVANLLSIRGETAKADKIWQLRQKLISQSEDIELKRLFVIGTQGRPRDPFAHLESQKSGLDLSEYVATNIVFGNDIASWIVEVYEYAQSIS